jgi:hypothetical protein
MVVGSRRSHKGDGRRPFQKESRERSGHDGEEVVSGQCQEVPSVVVVVLGRAGDGMYA